MSQSSQSCSYLLIKKIQIIFSKNKSKMSKLKCYKLQEEKEEEKAKVPEKVAERAGTPDQPQTPDSDSPRDKSPKKKAPAAPVPATDRERTPTPESGVKVSPREEKEPSPEPEKKEVKESPKKEEEKPVPGPSVAETTPTTEETTPSVEETTPTGEGGIEEPMDIGTIAPPPEFLEDGEDKLSDEGIGPSADEKSDTSSQVSNMWFRVHIRSFCMD